MLWVLICFLLARPSTKPCFVIVFYAIQTENSNEREKKVPGLLKTLPNLRFYIKRLKGM